MFMPNLVDKGGLPSAMIDNNYVVASVVVGGLNTDSIFLETSSRLTNFASTTGTLPL